MRKPTDGQLAIGALIAFAFWIFVALPLYYGQRDDAATHKCSAKEEKDYSFWEKARCDPVAYFTLWLVGFTGVLAVSTIGLWWVTWRGSVRQSRDMQATLDHSRESLLAIERAFVAFSHIDITTISQHNIIIDYRFRLHITNSGRTAARNYAAQVNLALFDTIPNEFRFADRLHDEPAKSVIGPQTRTFLQVDFFIQDALATFEKKKIPLIWGWIEYDDIFPNSPRRRTEFCMIVEVFADPRHTPQVLQGNAVSILSARPWERYNGHDDDCLYRPGETPIATEGELLPLTPPPENQPPLAIP
jgi:hypothetical protein